MALTKRQRLRQIHRWLEANFPGPKPSTLVFVRERDGVRAGKADYQTGWPDVIITVNTYNSEHECIMTLLEEHAHAQVMVRGSHLHTKLWGDAYQKIREHWSDRGGERVSRSC